MTIIKVEKLVGVGQDASWTEQKAPVEGASKSDLTSAVSVKKAGERIHVCHHDENPPRPCEVL